jgi:hypothetical protein
MRIHREALVRAQGCGLAVVVLLAWTSASAAPPPEPALPNNPTVVATDLEGVSNVVAALRANPYYSGVVLIRLDGLRPSSFSLAGVVNVPPTPNVVPLGEGLRFENTLPGLPPAR